MFKCGFATCFVLNCNQSKCWYFSTVSITCCVSQLINQLHKAITKYVASWMLSTKTTGNYEAEDSAFQDGNVIGFYVMWFAYG